jgi:hypothetical protein
MNILRYFKDIFNKKPKEDKSLEESRFMLDNRLHYDISFWGEDAEKQGEEFSHLNEIKDLLRFHDFMNMKWEDYKKKYYALTPKDVYIRNLIEKI